MRICALRFKNLNSLSGDWSIDFTHPAYSANGIFAITGPTGAGKTTILDALCLALYGRTPRLGKITKSSNEIMSRRHGECEAEVSFETAKGRYRCHWSQRRARKRPDGDLQPPRHEIVEIASGMVLENKLREVGRRVEDLTGMDFDRFIRTMLLAQGGFAAFLQADPDERAPILEQITGTAIYSEISKRVHERCAAEGKALAVLEAEIEAVRLMSPEEKETLEAELAALGEKDAEVSRRLETVTLALAWYAEIQRLESEQKRLAGEREHFDEEMRAFAQDEKRLRLALKALELSADHAALVTRRREQGNDQRQVAALTSQLPAAKEGVKAADVARSTAAENEAAARKDLSALQKTLREVRALDTTIAARGEALEAERARHQAIRTRLHGLLGQEADLVRKLAANDKAREEWRRRRENSRCDEILVERLAALDERCRALAEIHTLCRNREKEVAAARAACSRAAAELAACQAGLEKQRTAKKALDVERGECEAARKKLLAGRGPAAWRTLWEEQRQQAERLVHVLEAVRQCSEGEQALAEMRQRRAVLEEERKRAEKDLHEAERQLRTLDGEVAHLETELTLLQRISNLEEARKELADGCPCPLCGALEHPFAAGNIPTQGAVRERLQAAREEQRHGLDTVTGLRTRGAAIAKELADLGAACREREDMLTQHREFLSTQGPVFDFDPAAPSASLIAGIEKRIAAAREAGTAAGEVLRRAEAMDETLNRIAKKLDRAARALNDEERSEQDRRHRLDTARRNHQRLADELTVLQSQRERERSTLLAELQPLGVAENALDDPKALLGALTARRDQWQTLQRQGEDLEKERATLGRDLDHCRERLRAERASADDQAAVLAAAEKELSALADKRRALFADKDCDAEEKRAVETAEAAASALTAAETKARDARRGQERLETAITALEEQIRQRGQDLATQEEAFLARLGAAGFADEQAFMAACLDPAEREALEEQSRRLTRRGDELRAMIDNNRTALAAERAKNLSTTPADDLLEEQAQCRAAQKEIQRQTGAGRQRLQENAKAEKRLRQRLQELDGRRRECARWENLRELIGSADGKKYRNFAQGLTFEVMVNHANRRLRRLSDRYLLLRDPHSPLDLMVVDNYQAGEIRSIKNLSGGESFLVSLALALGLSKMAGANVRVDSLFLDEGFGTLDDDALDTALEALAALRQEGKLIGVISHVAALHERIAAQIEVIPGPGGHSRLKGPGVGA